MDPERGARSRGRSVRSVTGTRTYHARTEGENAAPLACARTSTPTKASSFVASRGADQGGVVLRRATAEGAFGLLSLPSVE